LFVDLGLEWIKLGDELKRDRKVEMK